MNLTRFLLAISIFITLLPQVSLAQSGPSTVTLGMRNGSFWTQMFLQDKSAAQGYLCGVAEGWLLRGDTEDSTSGMTLLLSPGSESYDTLTDMVTSVYKDTANQELPIPWVLLAEISVLRGKTSNDRVLPALRRHLFKLRTSTSSGTDLSPENEIYATFFINDKH